MRRVTSRLVTLLALGMLTGCGVVTHFGVWPDLTVENIWMTTDSADRLVALRIIFSNVGAAGDADYQVCLSPTFQLKGSTTHPLYRDHMVIGRNTDALVDLGFQADIYPYMSAHDLLFPSGDFYLAVALDPEHSVDEDAGIDSHGAIGPFRFRDGRAIQAVGDVHEPDDAPPPITPSPDPAFELPPDTVQERTFHTPDDVDWMWIHAEAGQVVRVRTFPGSGADVDTRLWVYDAAVPFQPGFDPDDWIVYPPIRFCDDDGFDHFNGITGMDEPWDDPDTESVYSAVRFTAPYTGCYVVRVDEFGDQEGSYRIHYFVE